MSEVDAVATAVSAERERLNALEYVGEALDEFFRNGSSTVRVVIDDVDDETWQAIDAEVVTRYPDGEVKVERVAVGLAIEWVRER